jgi:hypothetical protein
MSNFRLLRSNKETGPYTADDLRQMGLKPYDLIWVEGKSAAWRYPGEVDELKSFAPPVEEQPYDRFYKKPAASAGQPEAEEPADVPQPPQVVKPPVQTPPPTPSTRKEKEYKRVFVTLPNSAPTPRPVVQKPAPVTEYKAPVAEVPPQLPSQPFAEKKAEASEIYYPKKKTSSLRGMTVAGVIIAMMAMIGVGIVIGLSIDPKKEVALNSSATGTQEPSASEAVIPASNLNQPAVSEVPSPDQFNAQLPQTEEPQVVNTATKPVVKKPVTQQADTNLQKSIASTPLEQSQPAPEKDEEPVKKAVSKPAPNLEKQVAVSSNDYEVGPFGGISKLAFTVKNTSEYDISLVVVQVEYLKANKEVFKTENLYFRDLAANSSLTLDAPRSSRGNKVSYKVTLINSKDHIFHAGN